MSLGLGSNLTKSGIVTPGIVTSNLVLKHKYDAGAVVPISDGAASFDGSSDYVAITTPSVFNGETLNSFNASIAGWANFDTIGQYEAIISIGTFDFEIAPTSSSAVGIWVNNAAYGGSTYTPTLNTWNYYAATKDGNTYKLYVDGVLIGSNDDTDNATVASTSSIGSNNGSSNFFDGYICNAAMWSGVLTQAQIKSIMNKRYTDLTSSETTNLVSWWSLDSTARDSFGSYHGTLS